MPSPSTRHTCWRNLFQRNVTRKILTWMLVLGSIAYLTHMLRPELEELRASIVQVRWWQVLLAAIVAAPMYLLKGIYHLSLLDRLSGEKTSVRQALPVYLQAQLVRYLPGKIWGILYQTHRMTTTHKAADVVIANVWQMGTTNLFALGVVITVLLALRDSLLWLMLLLPVAVGIEWLHRHPFLESWGLRQLHRRLPRLLPALPTPNLPPMPIKGSLILGAEWVFYFLAFLVLLQGQAELRDALASAAWYGGASLIALAAFVVPAGLAVREAIFVGSPAVVGLDAASLAITAALARVSFFLAEVLVAAAATAFSHGIRHGRT